MGSLVLAVVGLAGLSACLEPNPNLTEGGSETAGTTNETGSEAESEGQPEPCDPCELAFSTATFDAGPDGTTVEIPKPDQPNTAAIALVQVYEPGGAAALGYAIEWEESGDAYTLSLSLTDANDDSRVAGLAVVVGSASAIDSQTFDADASNCGSQQVEADNRVLVHAVETYNPDSGDVASYSGTREAGNGEDTIEYCFDNADSEGASLQVRVLSFEAGEGPVVETRDAIPVSGNGTELTEFSSLPSSAEVVHLLAVTAYDEGNNASDLGYGLDCDPSQAPYGCELSLIDFGGGAQVIAAGAAVGIP